VQKGDDKMEEENKEVMNDILDDVEEEVEEEKELVETEDVEFGDFSDQPKLDVELLPEDKDKVFTIEQAERKEPILKDQNGLPIKAEPLSPNDPTRLGYTTKLVLTFKDTSYAAIIPSIKWYQTIVEDPETKKTKRILKPWFNVNVKESELENPQVSAISKLFYRYCKTNNLDMKKVTQKQFIEGLAGQKVKLKTVKGNYKGKDWSKIEVTEFVK
jgi:hypothetical protein